MIAAPAISRFPAPAGSTCTIAEITTRSSPAPSRTTTSPPAERSGPPPASPKIDPARRIQRPARKTPTPARRTTLRPLILTQIRFTREMRGRFGTGRETDKTAVRWADFFGDIETARRRGPQHDKALQLRPLAAGRLLPDLSDHAGGHRTAAAGLTRKRPLRNFLKAWDNAFARTNDTTISADVITYDSKSDLMYANGQEGRMVHVVKQNSVGQPISPTIAEAVRVNPKTGEANAIGPRDLQWVDNRTGARPTAVAPPIPTPRSPRRPRTRTRSLKAAPSARASRAGDCRAACLPE